MQFRLKCAGEFWDLNGMAESMLSIFGRINSAVVEQGLGVGDVWI